MKDFPSSSSTLEAPPRRDDHRYLLDVAVRVLGSISEAEDTVQEAFAGSWNSTSTRSLTCADG